MRGHVEEALAVFDGAGVDLYAAGGVELDGGATGVGEAVAIAEAEADDGQAPAAFLVGSEGAVVVLFGSELVEGRVDAFDGGGDGNDLAGGDGVAAVDEVSFPEFDAVNAEAHGEAVHHAVVGDGHLAGAEAAHGAGGVVVGEDAVDVDVDIWDAQRAGGVAGGFAKDGGAGGGVGAFVGKDGDLGGCEGAVFLCADGVMNAHGVALVAGTHGLFSAVAHGDGLAGVFEGADAEVDLDGEVFAAAECAAGRGGDDADGFHGQAEGEGNEAAFFVSPLAGDLDGEEASIPLGDAGFDIEEGVIDGLGEESLADDDIAGG